MRIATELSEMERVVNVNYPTTVVITGAASGIGLAAALASRGLALNPIWISIVLGLQLGAVTPIT